MSHATNKKNIWTAWAMAHPSRGLASPMDVGDAFTDGLCMMLHGLELARLD